MTMLDLLVIQVACYIDEYVAEPHRAQLLADLKRIIERHNAQMRGRRS